MCDGTSIIEGALVGWMIGQAIGAVIVLIIDWYYFG